ncbi:MAG: recombination mediator RecR [Rikenellaceae bacterium]
MSKLLDNVVEHFSRLPGIGHRTALRLSMHLLKMDVADTDAMADAIAGFRREVKFCKQCNNISDNELCDICSDPKRDRSVICVVENVKDVISIESSRGYNGLYHVLGGVISPMQGIGPSQLRIELLLDNIAKGEIKEVILAISTTIEGETTSFYISRRLAEVPNIKVTEIARGLGFGDELDYADELTITHALHNRSQVEK